MLTRQALAKSKMHFIINDEKITIKELEELFDKIATDRQKLLLNLQKKNYCLLIFLKRKCLNFIIINQ